MTSRRRNREVKLKMWAAVWAAVGAIGAAIVAGGWAWWDLKQTVKAQASNLQEQITFQVSAPVPPLPGGSQPE